MADADKNRVIVLAVVEGSLSVSEAARRFGVTRQWVHRLVARYRQHGLAGLDEPIWALRDPWDSEPVFALRAAARTATPPAAACHGIYLDPAELVSVSWSRR